MALVSFLLVPNMGHLFATSSFWDQFTGSLLRRSLDNILLWGRPKPGESLKNTTLTQFAPEVWTGLYPLLFMFDGNWRLDYDQSEQLNKARLGAVFRNALDPGQYPYPFWHDAKKWNDYQAANTLVLWIAPQSGRIVAGQFIRDSQDSPSLQSAPVAGLRSGALSGRTQFNFSLDFAFGR
jgi:hypothetical protein